jgi:hypothetical protein
VHVPIVVFTDEQDEPYGHPLPPLPRQPGTHAPMSAEQTLPLRALPQWESIKHLGVQVQDWQLPLRQVGFPPT